MPSGEASRLAPCHTCSRVHWHGKAVHRDRGARGNEVPLLRCSRRVDIRHARICPRDGAQVNQHRPLLHAISRTLKWLGIPHQVESSEPFMADKKLPIDIVIMRGGLRVALNRAYRDKSILLDVTHANPQAQVLLRGGSAGQDGSAASTSGARKRQRSSGTCVLRRTEAQNLPL